MNGNGFAVKYSILMLHRMEITYSYALSILKSCELPSIWPTVKTIEEALGLAMAGFRFNIIQNENTWKIEEAIFASYGSQVLKSAMRRKKQIRNNTYISWL